MSRNTAALWLACALLGGCRATIEDPKLPDAWTAADASRPLSRADCVDLALRSAPNAAAWEARLASARAQVEQARLLPNPTLTLGWEDFGLNAAAAGSVQTTISLAMALEDVAARKRRSAAASQDLLAVQADLRAERNKITADVSRGYDQLLGARARAQLTAELEQIAEKQRSDIGQLVASGIAARIQLERADAELAEARAQLATSTAQSRAAELELAFALGFERPVALQLSDAMTDASADADLETALSLAAQRRPEIEAAHARYRAERERLKLTAERVQFLPTVGAGPRFQGDELRGVATIDVALPVFDSGAAREHAQSAALLAAAAELRATAQRVAREVSTARERQVAADAFLSGYARDLAERRRVLRERTERLFRAGEAEYAELALARRDEVQARMALLDAQLTAASARVDFAAAVGPATSAQD